METDFAPPPLKKVRIDDPVRCLEEPVALVRAAAMHRVDDAFAAKAKGDQVDCNFLVVEDVLPEAICEGVLDELLALHRPQKLVYAGNGEGGASYTNSWCISTYAHTSPETYVYQVFQATYGAPYDDKMRAYMHNSGLVALLNALKSRFVTTLGRASSLDAGAIERWVREMRLAQLFLTVQPAAHEMAKLDTYLQVYIYRHTHAHAHTHTHTHTINIYTYMYVCIILCYKYILYIYIVHTHTHTHTHITHTHTHHTHTHTHTHTCIFRVGLYSKRA
jgi:hypothetical protein